MRPRSGFTMLELLIAMTILGVIFSVGGISAYTILKRSQENSSLNSIQHSIWQAAGLSSSRGIVTTIVKSGQTLSVKNESSGATLRSFKLADGVQTNFPEGEVMRFLPPGEISEESYQNLPSPITLSTSNGNYTMLVSVIGEAKVVEANEQ
ncbi:MAG: type II secretion system protein [Trueperaceae bacterium]|nr:type II secretion system protein [Trueperaceae bacterium]